MPMSTQNQFLLLSIHKIKTKAKATLTTTTFTSNHLDYQTKTEEMLYIIKIYFSKNNMCLFFFFVYPITDCNSYY